MWRVWLGSNTHRPHFHIILFGLSKEDFNFNRLGDPEHRFDITGSRIVWCGTNELGQNYYKCDWLAEDVWTHGFVCLSDVSWKTCAYVARYVKKKDMGLVQDAYRESSVEPEYSVMSRSPGIGMYYPIEHSDCFEKNITYVADQDGVTKVSMPGSFLRTLYNSDRKKYDELKYQRQKFSNDSEFSKLIQTDLSSMELYELSENRIIDSEKVIDFYRGL